MKFVKLVSTLVLANLVLGGCSVAVKPIAHGITEGLGKGMGCAIASAFQVFSAGPHLKMEKADFDRFILTIQKQKIKSQAQFWKQISPGDAEILLEWINEGYQAYKADGDGNEPDVKFFEDLFAYGMIQAATQPKDVGRYHFYYIVGTKQKSGTTEYRTYRLSLTLLGASNQENAEFTLCK